MRGFYNRRVSLTPGSRLGAYDVLAVIGAGGMGEVYRARDSSLQRDVALKVLPDAFVLDPDRLARFKREAQVLAALNHPNIAAIYGFEESGGAPTLVLELVDGPTLADRIAQGPLPLDEALPIAAQIADALEAAHEQGIVHRDLKPANIKVRPDGAVKVLDFGLAKALDPPGGTPASDHSPTITSPALTRAGLILGTAAYMSPEQARGRQADARSDVWAFGVVLLEMLTGQRTFKGDDVADTLAAVLRAEPSWSTLPAGTPPSIRRLLRRCLQKDPRRRLQHIGDARLELADADQPEAAEPAALRHAVTAALVAARRSGDRRRDHRRPRRVDAGAHSGGPAGEPLLDSGAGPGGPRHRHRARRWRCRRTAASIVYVVGGAQPGPRDGAGSTTCRPSAIRGTEGGTGHSSRPTASGSAFFADGKLKKVRVDGGAPVNVADAPPQCPRGLGRRRHDCAGATRPATRVGEWRHAADAARSWRRGRPVLRARVRARREGVLVQNRRPPSCRPHRSVELATGRPPSAARGRVAEAVVHRRSAVRPRREDVGDEASTPPRSPWSARRCRGRINRLPRRGSRRRGVHHGARRVAGLPGR